MNLNSILIQALTFSLLVFLPQQSQSQVQPEWQTRHAEWLKWRTKERLREFQEQIGGCRHARPKCDSYRASDARFFFVPEEDKPILYAGGCLLNGHGILNFNAGLGDQVHTRARQAYEELVAVAAAKGASQCGRCPSDEFWVSKIGKNLSKSGRTSDAKAWQQLTKQCRPESEHVDNDPECNIADLPQLGFEGSNDDPIDPRGRGGVGMITDLARLAQGVYSNELISFERAEGGTFERESFYSSGNGLDMATYIDPEAKEAVIVYRGTETHVMPDGINFEEADMRDWRNNLVQGTSFLELPDHFKEAIVRGQKDLDRLRKAGYDVAATGHSQGGALAEVLHQTTGVRTITFNPMAPPSQTAIEDLYNAPVRETGNNLIRVHNSNDIARITDFGINREEGGSNLMVEYDVSGQIDTSTGDASVNTVIGFLNRVMAHSMEEMASYWDKEYARLAKSEMNSVREGCPEEQ